MNVPSRVLSAVVVLTALLGQARAADSIEAEIRPLVDAYVAAFNAHDTAALAAQWTPEAVYVNELSGETYTGRDAISADFAEQFTAQPQAKLQVEVASVERLSPHVAVEHGSATIVDPQSPSQPVPYTAVYVKRDGTWLLDRLTDHRTVQVASHYEQLKPLEWMVGNWVDDTDEVRVATSCQWTKNRNYLLRAYSIEAAGQVHQSGMQIIGWDGATKQIRSWTFDSDGGFAQATWMPKGDRWYVHNAGVLANGQPASAVQVIKPIDANSFSWQIVDRTAAGNLLPNVEEVIIVRE